MENKGLTTEQINQIVENFYEGLKPFIETVNKAMPSILAACHVLYDGVWEQYRTAGSPYGDTQENMMRWLGEQSEIRRMESEIEYIKMRQEAMADFRELVRMLNEAW